MATDYYENKINYWYTSGTISEQRHFCGERCYIKTFQENNGWKISFIREKDNKLLMTFGKIFDTQEEAKIMAGYHATVFNIFPATGPHEW